MRRLNRDALFGHSHEHKSLAAQTVKGGVSTMTSQGVQFLLNTVGTMILARVLAPDDFGLVGIVMVFVGFAEMLKSAGLSMATIQKESITEQQTSTLFWINILISAGIALVLAAIAPLVGYFYEREELTLVLMIQSFAVVFGGLSIQHQALLRRHLQFTSIAMIQIVATVVRQCVAILFAYLGWDYMSLVFGAIALSFATTVGTFYFCPWFPGRPTRAKGVFGMLKFGGHMTLFSVINYATTHIGQAILGKTEDSATVGNYAKAKGILMIPLTRVRAPITSVLIPVLSRLQNDPEKYRRYYYSVVFLLAFVTMPLTMIFMLYPDEIVLLYLGPQWHQAAELFSIFCWYSLVYAVSTLRGMVLISQGKSKRYSVFGLIHGVSNIVGLLVGSFYGAAGIAWAFVIANYIIFLPTLFYCFKDTPITVSGYFKACYLPLIVCLVGGGGIKLIDGYWVDFGYMRIVFGGILFITFYAAFWLLAMKMRWQPELEETKDLLLSMVAKKRSKWSSN